MMMDVEVCLTRENWLGQPNTSLTIYTLVKCQPVSHSECGQISTTAPPTRRRPVCVPARATRALPPQGWSTRSALIYLPSMIGGRNGIRWQKTERLASLRCPPTFRTVHSFGWNGCTNAFLLARDCGSDMIWLQARPGQARPGRLLPAPSLLAEARKPLP
jgi:hypothetical protein